MINLRRVFAVLQEQLQRIGRQLDLMLEKMLKLTLLQDFSWWWILFL